MAELTTTKLNAEQHLLLSRKTFKTAQRLVDREQTHILKELKTTTQTASCDAEGSLASLDNMISRMTTLKRKLEALHTEEKGIQRATRARLQHLDDLYAIPSLADVKYEDWSKVRLDRLLVDHMLRSGYNASAEALAKEKNIAELVDVDAFVSCDRIAGSLRVGKCVEALNWCADNKQGLKKMESGLEFELRMQQYVEMLRSGDAKKKEAILHARKYLATNHNNTFASLLAFPPDTPVEPYRTLYSPDRWAHLAELFTKTHHALYALPPRPLLHIALSAGLSALKTPACHSEFASSSTNNTTTSTSVCPICSTELNELARNVPYAHHTKSHVEDDPVYLPTGRIYGRERLREMNEKLGTAKGYVKDPMVPNLVYEEAQIKKVFIS
ncbi:hypothetical protein K490DRAFT_56709 [Saccharata proteae CBS 121410]|uniref:Protein FYV10 n=1 Tax=Saccharata proteae CBS 121410 TaxID=1314787 RepID=A0A9P4HWB3_9PEZI|nr:hypothetical protein K490DRAFT_56709 [Saccharata proteae CBS 121410]